MLLFDHGATTSFVSAFLARALNLEVSLVGWMFTVDTLLARALNLEVSLVGWMFTVDTPLARALNLGVSLVGWMFNIDTPFGHFTSLEGMTLSCVCQLGLEG